MKLVPTQAQDLKEGDWIIVAIGGRPKLVHLVEPQQERNWSGGIDYRINDHEDNYVAWAHAKYLLSRVEV